MKYLVIGFAQLSRDPIACTSCDGAPLFFETAQEAHEDLKSFFADLEAAGMETDLSWQVVPADQVDIGQLIVECGL